MVGLATRQDSQEEEERRLESALFGELPSFLSQGAGDVDAVGAIIRTAVTDNGDGVEAVPDEDVSDAELLCLLHQN